MKQTFKLVFSVLLFSMMSLSGFAQNAAQVTTITGKVVDKDGLGVIGLNVIEKGTKNGTLTDIDGAYKIQVPKGAVLQFSYIGMKTQERTVGASSTINITMLEDASSLEEVVVVGYGTQKKEHLTSAVETVKISEIEDLPVGNLASALVGRVLGVSVSGGDRRPGAGAGITIRNPAKSQVQNGGTTDPLYVIDGILQVDPDTGWNDSTQFNNLDASEVESISFLKDASAAIYGSRATQGVVLVTTKRGKKGPAKFTYSGNYSIADETYRTRMMNAYEFGLATNIMAGPNGAGQINDPSNTNYRNYFFTPNELDHFKTINYDFLEDNWSSATTQRHNVNVSGGDDNGTYFAGISYYTQDGNLGTLNYDRWSFRAGSSVKLSKGLNANFQVSGYFTDESKTFSKVGSEDNEDDFQELQNRSPFLPMYINGLPAVMPSNRLSSDRLLGYHYEEIQRLNNLAESKDNNVTVNATIEYEVPFIKGLKFQGRYARAETKARGTQLGFKYPLYQFNGPNADDDYIFYESGSGPLGENTINTTSIISNGDRILISNSSRKRVQTNFQGTYARDFGKHSVSALFSIEKSESEYFQDRIIKEGNVPSYSTGMLWEIPNATADYSNTFNWRDESGDLGYIGRVNYAYDGKYLGEFLFRSDASAKFAPNNYWGKFYSVSGGWIISKEDFFKSNVIDFLKVRTSVGMLGKDDVTPWAYLQSFGFQIDKGAVFGGNLGVSPGLRTGNPANATIKWSDELKTNFGVEARFLNNRLSTTIENYYNIGKNILSQLTQAVPFTVGGASTSLNYAEIDTWGTEISVSWNDEIGDFSYGATVNTGWGNEKVNKGNFADISTLRPWQVKPGGSSDIGIWGYDYQGMFKTQDEITAYLAETGITQIFNKNASQLRPGMFYYRDVRGAWDSATRTFAAPDGKIDENDQIQLRKRVKGPSGFATTLRLGYKQFSLNAVITTDWGGYNEISGSARSAMPSDQIFRNYENRPAFWADQYDPELNPDGKLPNMARANSGINFVRSDYWKVNNLNINLRNINISYALPKNLAEKMSLSSLRFNLIAMNPFILYNPYKKYGLPPTGDYSRFPILKTYSLGLNVGF